MTLVVMGHRSQRPFSKAALVACDPMPEFDSSRPRTVSGLCPEDSNTDPHIRQFLQKLRITRQLERFGPMWLKTVALPDRLTVALLTPCCSAIVRQLQWVAPAGRLRRVVLMIPSTLSAESRGFRPRPVPLPKTVRPFFEEALPPQGDRFTINLHILGDLFIFLTFGCLHMIRQRCATCCGVR